MSSLPPQRSTPPWTRDDWNTVMCTCTALISLGMAVAIAILMVRFALSYDFK